LFDEDPWFIEAKLKKFHDSKFKKEKEKENRTFEFFLKTGTRHYLIFCILKKFKIDSIFKMKNNQLITLASKCLQCLVVITNRNAPLTVIRAVPGVHNRSSQNTIEPIHRSPMYHGSKKLR